MKKIPFCMFILVVLLTSCTQKVKEPEKAASENTLTSISFFSDTTRSDPSAIMKAFEIVNKAIDSIGYPDAGYKLWLVQSDTTKNIRFMIQGSWPDQEVYNTIHKNELYTDAMKGLQQSAKNLKSEFYSRFILVK